MPVSWAWIKGMVLKGASAKEGRKRTGTAVDCVEEGRRDTKRTNKRVLIIDLGEGGYHTRKILWGGTTVGA